jgi:hypothetical protein
VSTITALSYLIIVVRGEMMTDIKFDIHIEDKKGMPRVGIKVDVSYSDLTHDENHTDGDGWVVFEKRPTVWYVANISKLYVNDDVIDTDVNIEDGDSFSYIV